MGRRWMKHEIMERVMEGNPRMSGIRKQTGQWEQMGNGKTQK
jgi:hypothetical protein